MKSVLFLLFAMALIAVAAPRQTNPDERIVTHSPAHAAPQQKPAPAASQPGPKLNQQEAEAMRKDLQQMHVLLNQMQTNLAFVQTSDTPLKHQFDLNNDMWQAMLSDLERRLQKLEQQKP